MNVSGQSPVTKRKYHFEYSRDPCRRLEMTNLSFGRTDRTVPLVRVKTVPLVEFSIRFFQPIDFYGISEARTRSVRLDIIDARGRDPCLSIAARITSACVSGLGLVSEFEATP